MTPRQTLLAGAVMLAVAVVFIVAGAQNAHRSSMTQHAVPIVAQVVADDETHHSSRNGGYWTSAYEVREPSGGLVWARAHDRKDDALVGRAVRVVVDPQDPTYAELAGAPMSTWTGVWLGGVSLTLLALLMLGIGLQRLRSGIGGRGGR